MSLAILSGKVSAITNGSKIGNYANTKIFGNSSFLRNNERGYDTLVSEIGALQNILTDLSGAAGIKQNMYVIGAVSDTGDATASDENSWWQRRVASLVNSASSKLTRAVSYWTGLGDGVQTGVIIDGFDNFRGDISVALPDNPVMYDTSVVDQVVRNPNRLTMRVYVDLMHTDDIVQNALQAFANSFAGLTGTIMNAITGDTMNRAQKALSGLQWIQENGSPFKVYTPHKVYDNMMIEKIAPTNDQQMNEILVADITFKEVIPTRSLGNQVKTTARMVPNAAASATARLAGWLS